MTTIKRIGAAVLGAMRWLVLALAALASVVAGWLDDLRRRLR